LKTFSSETKQSFDTHRIQPLLGSTFFHLRPLYFGLRVGMEKKSVSKGRWPAPWSASSLLFLTEGKALFVTKLICFGENNLAVAGLFRGPAPSSEGGLGP
jgi:hypothetical protein